MTITMAYKSDKDALLDELDEIELILLKNETWTPEVSQFYIRREEVRKLLKQMGNKEWL